MIHLPVYLSIIQFCLLVYFANSQLFCSPVSLSPNLLVYPDVPKVIGKLEIPFAQWRAAARCAIDSTSLSIFP